MSFDYYRIDQNYEPVKCKYEYGQRLDMRWTIAAYVGVDGLGLTFFCRNNTGASRLADTLERHGLGFWSDVPMWGDAVGKEFEVVCQSKLAKAYMESAGLEYFDDLPEAVQRRFLPKTTKHLSATYSDRPGIALHKLCGSNDGWHITSAEYRSMLALFDKLDVETRTDLLSSDWTANGGFGTDFCLFARACAMGNGSITR